MHKPSLLIFLLSLSTLSSASAAALQYDVHLSCFYQDDQQALSVKLDGTSPRTIWVSGPDGSEGALLRPARNGDGAKIWQFYEIAPAMFTHDLVATDRWYLDLDANDSSPGVRNAVLRVFDPARSGFFRRVFKKIPLSCQYTRLEIAERR